MGTGVKVVSLSDLTEVRFLRTGPMARIKKSRVLYRGAASAEKRELEAGVVEVPLCEE